MRLMRTANAGCLLELDGCKLLLDGVCQEVFPYLATPDSVKRLLTDPYPDLVAVTHRHEDHCDMDFEQKYREATGRQVFGSEQANRTWQCGSVRITAIPGRHIGKQDCDHVSFILQGSCCVWFMGDAAPAQWKNRQDLPKPDVMIVPFAYANTATSWEMVQAMSPKCIVVLHMPAPDNDPYGLHNAVMQTVGQGNSVPVFIPAVEGFVEIDF